MILTWNKHVNSFNVAVIGSLTLQVIPVLMKSDIGPLVVGLDPRGLSHIMKHSRQGKGLEV